MKYIVFDLGNVILNIDSENSLEKFSKITSIKKNKILQSVILADDKSGYEKGFCNDSQFFSKSITMLAECSDFSEQTLKKNLSEKVFFNLWNNIFQVNTDMLELIKDLSKQFPLTLLSNTNNSHFEYCINKWPVLKLFKNYLLSYKVGLLKPDVNIYRHLADKTLNTKPENIIFFDDLSENIKGAEKIGIISHVFSDHIETKKLINRFFYEKI